MREGRVFRDRLEPVRRVPARPAHRSISCGVFPQAAAIDTKVFSFRQVKLFASDPSLAKEYAAAGGEMRAIFGDR
jgi:hypothetical protein